MIFGSPRTDNFKSLTVGNRKDRILLENVDKNIWNKNQKEAPWSRKPYLDTLGKERGSITWV